MLRRWVVESSQGRNSQLATIAEPPLTALANSDFIPFKFDPAPSAQIVDIRIKLAAELIAKIAQQSLVIAERDSDILYRQAKIEKLTHELTTLKRWKCGRISELLS